MTCQVRPKVEVVDVARAEVDLQGVEDVGERHAQLLRLVAVDVDVELRRVGAEGREQLASSVLPGLADRVVWSPARTRQAAAATILDLHPEAAGLPRPRTGGGGNTTMNPSWIPCDRFPQRVPMIAVASFRPAAYRTASSPRRWRPHWSVA